jgi:hypothetical protein
MQERHLGDWLWSVAGDPAALLFTENDTNLQRLFGARNSTPYVKDGINDYVVLGRSAAVNPEQIGTKATAHYVAQVAPGETFTVCVRFRPQRPDDPFSDFDAVFDQR